MPTRIEIRGEALGLFPERAVFWPKRRTLILSDIHFGKDQYFRLSGVPIPQGLTESLLANLQHLVALCEPARILVLGDFWHHKFGISEDVDSKLLEWQDENRDLKWHVIPGNHDRRLEEWADRWNLVLLNDFLLEPPFLFTHDPSAIVLPKSTSAYLLSGHLHPAVRLQAPGFPDQKLPCFWLSKDYGVLPAFNTFTGLNLQKYCKGDQIGVIADNEVILWDY
ncbi:MAG: ligase-associated DNA damage response endonuclease PdeM [Planctomycetota bacterium]|nr:ligase-associated DNA damage response endonuclease PdeM [Planctomycetota bacterium]